MGGEENGHTSKGGETLELGPVQEVVVLEIRNKADVGRRKAGDRHGPDCEGLL